MSYLNSVTIIGFVGADPEQRQARNNNGSKFTVLSVATQQHISVWHALGLSWGRQPRVAKPIRISSRSGKTPIPISPSQKKPRWNTRSCSNSVCVRIQGRRPRTK